MLGDDDDRPFGTAISLLTNLVLPGTLAQVFWAPMPIVRRLTSSSSVVETSFSIHGMVDPKSPKRAWAA